MTEHRPHRSRPAEVYWRWTLVFSLGFLIAFVFFAAGVLAERSLFREGAMSELGDAIGGLASESPDKNGQDRVKEIRHLIEEEYYYRPVDEEAQAEFERQLEYNAIRGMTEGLEDDYTTFLVPVEQQPISEQLSGEYEGIGVWVQYPDGRFTIVAAMPGSPAEEAGLRAGDVILAADGQALTNVAEDDALKLVRGPAGSTVRLTIQRNGDEPSFEVDVMRRRITMPAVDYELLPDGNIGYIQVTIFGDKTTEQLDAAIRQAEEDEVSGIVLDLRNNGGGWVTAAQEMVGRFVSPDVGPALYEDTHVGENVLEPEAVLAGDVAAYDLPVAVLVNEGTASAAEIVAGALQDHERAVIVGVTTFGKGSVQRVHDFADGSSARITFALWLTPDQHQIEGIGIEPDLHVEMPMDSNETDLQLIAAVEALVSGTPTSKD